MGWVCVYHLLHSSALGHPTRMHLHAHTFQITQRGADGKMSREQYMALRRKVGGTAKDFFKSWVEEEQVKTIKTYTNSERPGGSVPFLGFLVGVVVAMIATTAAVVAQTAPPH